MIRVTTLRPVRATEVRQPPQWGFLLSSSLLFIVASLATVLLCDRMESMGGMSMPGGWTMSMMWMRMPGQSWPGTAATFTGMWALMMFAMMMPVLALPLARYRRALHDSRRHSADLLILAIASGYFCVWIVLGAAIFAFGAVVVAVEMRSAAVARIIPIVGGAVIWIAGFAQCSAWKADRLRCCYRALLADDATDVSAAWKRGMRLGFRCISCCAPLTATLVVLGMMDLRMMTAIAVITALERTRIIGFKVAQLTGIVAIAMGIWWVATAVRDYASLLP